MVIARKCDPDLIARLERTGELSGYRAGPPRYIADPAEVDATILAGEHCPACGRREMGYRQYHQEDRRERRHLRYRAFAICPCGHQEEI